MVGKDYFELPSLPTALISFDFARARRCSAVMRFFADLAAASLLGPSLDVPSEARFLLSVLPAAVLRTSARLVPLPLVLLTGPSLALPSAFLFLLSVSPAALVRTSARVVLLPAVLFLGPSLDVPSDERFLLSVAVVWAWANPMLPTRVATAAAVASNLDSVMVILQKKIVDEMRKLDITGRLPLGTSANGGAKRRRMPQGLTLPCNA